MSALPIDGRITSRWDEPRPLSNPGLWNHGAIDMAAKISTPETAPEDGWPFAFALFRPEGRTDPWRDKLKTGWAFPWGSYRHDVFGAVVGLKGESGRVHLFTHSYFNQVFGRGVFPREAWHYQEEKQDTRWPMFLWHTLSDAQPVHVVKGQTIGAVGNAGMSKGPHAHWEIHDGWTRTPHIERVDPEVWLEARRA